MRVQNAVEKAGSALAVLVAKLVGAGAKRCDVKVSRGGPREPGRELTGEIGRRVDSLGTGFFERPDGDKPELDVAQAEDLAEQPAMPVARHGLRVQPLPDERLLGGHGGCVVGLALGCQQLECQLLVSPSAPVAGSLQPARAPCSIDLHAVFYRLRPGRC